MTALAPARSSSTAYSTASFSTTSPTRIVTCTVPVTYRTTVSMIFTAVSLILPAITLPLRLISSQNASTTTPSPPDATAGTTPPAGPAEAPSTPGAPPSEATGTEAVTVPVVGSYTPGANSPPPPVENQMNTMSSAAAPPGNGSTTSKDPSSPTPSDKPISKPGPNSTASSHSASVTSPKPKSPNDTSADLVSTSPAVT